MSANTPILSIGAYLDFPQRLTFLSSTKLWLSHLKQIRYLSLDETQFTRFMHDIPWRQRVLGMVIYGNPDNNHSSLQRKLKVSVAYNLYLDSPALQEVKPYLVSIKAYVYTNNLHYLRGIPSIHLISGAFYRFERCPIIDVHGLEGTEEVTLEKFDNLFDVSALEHVKTLKLHHVPQHLDLTHFTNLHTLELVETPHVVLDVDKLQSLERLLIQRNSELMQCIANAAYVPPVKHLTLQYLDAGTLTCLYKMRTVQDLTLLCCDNNDQDIIVFPPALQKITIDRCPSIHNLQGLECCNEVHIKACPQFAEIGNTLQHCRKISIEDCNKFENVHALVNILDIKLVGCASIKDAKSLGAIPRLSIENCSSLPSENYPIPVNTSTTQHWSIEGGMFVDVRGYEGLYSLSLCNCDLVTDVSNLGKLHTLDISRCRRVKEVSALDNVKKLSLRYCESVCDASMLKHVEQLCLIGCEHIESIEGMHNVLCSDMPKKFQKEAIDRFFLDFSPNQMDPTFGASSEEEEHRRN